MLQFFDFVGLHLREFGTWLGALCTYECVYWNVRRVIEFLTLGYKIPIFETLSKHLWIGLQIDVLGIIQETFLSNVNLIHIMKKQIFSAFSFFFFFLKFINLTQISRDKIKTFSLKYIQGDTYVPEQFCEAF